MGLVSSADADVVDELDTNVDKLLKGENLFIGPVRSTVQDSVPSEAVFVEMQSGLLPEGYLDGNADTPEIRHPFLTITVRSCQDDFVGGQGLARDTYRALHNQFPNASYFYARIQSDEPLYIGTSEQREHLWTMTLRLRIEE